MNKDIHGVFVSRQEWQSCVPSSIFLWFSEVKNYSLSKVLRERDYLPKHATGNLNLNDVRQITNYKQLQSPPSSLA